MATIDADAPPGSFAEAPFTIRPMREGDLPRVLAIEVVCYSVPWKEATFLSLMRRTDSDLYVAEDEGGIIGYTACWTVIDQSELGNVAVTPEARGRGAGGALVDTVVDRVRERGARELFLEVRESNLGAQALYRERGFVVVSRRRSYYAHPTEDALVMRLRV
jgi:[ribosomal protein S18]-alanine N-acetyltransferase